MIDAHQLAILRQEIACAIEDGMKNGAAHLATALAKPPVEDDGIARLQPLENDVTLEQVTRALHVVVRCNSAYSRGTGVMVARNGTFSIEQQIAAWTTLRRAIDLPV